MKTQRIYPLGRLWLGISLGIVTLGFVSAFGDGGPYRPDFAAVIHAIDMNVAVTKSLPSGRRAPWLASVASQLKLLVVTIDEQVPVLNMQYPSGRTPESLASAISSLRSAMDQIVDSSFSQLLSESEVTDMRISEIRKRLDRAEAKMRDVQKSITRKDLALPKTGKGNL